MARGTLSNHFRISSALSVLIAGITLAGCSDISEDFPESCGSESSLTCGDNYSSEPTTEPTFTENSISEFENQVMENVPSVLGVDAHERVEGVIWVNVYLPPEKQDGLSDSEEDAIEDVFEEEYPEYTLDLWEKWFAGFDEINDTAESTFPNIVPLSDTEKDEIRNSYIYGSPPDLESIHYQHITINGPISEQEINDFVDEVIESYGMYAVYGIEIDTVAGAPQQLFPVEEETCLTTPGGNSVYVTDNEVVTRFIFADSPEDLYDYCS